MNLKKINDNQFEVTSKNFSAKINMNPRDAMVFAEISCSASDEATQTELLFQLHKLLAEEFGGKIIVQLPANLKRIAKEVGLGEHTEKVIVVPFETIKQSMAKIAEKKSIKKLTDYSLNELSGSEEINVFQQVFKFKEENADFVTQAKKDEGIYSAIAEREKSKLTSVRHFVLNNKDNAIVATFMLAFNESRTMAYAADIIVAKSSQNQGIAQLLLLKLTESLSSEYSSLIHICFIPGGDGAQTKGRHLYVDVLGAFSAEKLSEKADSKSSEPSLPILLAAFKPPQKHLLHAANRSLIKPHGSLDEAVKSTLISKNEKKGGDKLPSPVLSHSVTFPRENPTLTIPVSDVNVVAPPTPDETSSLVIQ